jgi:hypothetical protein
MLAEGGGQDYNFRRLMPPFVKSTILWFADVLPDISNALLAVLGVLMSFPEKAEKIEKNPLWRKAIAYTCIVFGLAGLAASTYQRRQATSKMEILVGNVNVLVTNTNTLITNTNATVTNTNALLTTFGLLMPQVYAINARVATLNVKIEEAKGNPQLVATLQAQAIALREQSDTASRKVLVAMEPGIVREMKAVSHSWYIEIDRLKTPMIGNPYVSPSDEQRVVGEIRDIDQNYSMRIRPMMITANELRIQLLQLLPPDKTRADEVYVATFVNAMDGKTTSYDELENAANYLEMLAKRVTSSGTKQPADQSAGPR